MKTRIAKRVEPALATLPAAARRRRSPASPSSPRKPNVAAQIEWLLRNGAAEVLVLPSQASAAAARADSLGRRSGAPLDARGRGQSAATCRRRSGVRRHPARRRAGDAQRPIGVRTLLDARSEAQAVHGLEMRTELRFGAAADELQRQLSEAPDQMLILGVSDLGAAARRVRAAVRRAGAVLDDDRVSARSRESR